MSDSFKTELSLLKLYEVGQKGGVSGSEQLEPSFWVNSGAVDVYVSNSQTAPALLSDMSLDTDDIAVQGLRQFGVIPSYIYLQQNSGTSTEIIVAGLEVKDLGAL